MSSRFSSNSEAFASELLENLEDMFPLYMNKRMYGYKIAFLNDNISHDINAICKLRYCCTLCQKYELESEYL